MPHDRTALAVTTDRPDEAPCSRDRPVRHGAPIAAPTELEKALAVLAVLERDDDTLA